MHVTSTWHHDTGVCSAYDNVVTYSKYSVLFCKTEMYRRHFRSLYKSVISLKMETIPALFPLIVMAVFCISEVGQKNGAKLMYAFTERLYNFIWGDNRSGLRRRVPIWLRVPHIAVCGLRVLNGGGSSLIFRWILSDQLIIFDVTKIVAFSSFMN